MVGSHEGGHLPFEFDVLSFISDSNNILVLRVDGNLAFDHVPPGDTPGGPEDVFPSHISNWPQTYFDFFPFCGIHHPVLLYMKPKDGIRDITVVTDIEDTTGVVKVTVENSERGLVRVSLLEGGRPIQREGKSSAAHYLRKVWNVNLRSSEID